MAGRASRMSSSGRSAREVGDDADHLDLGKVRRHARERAFDLRPPRCPPRCSAPAPRTAATPAPCSNRPRPGPRTGAPCRSRRRSRCDARGRSRPRCASGSTREAGRSRHRARSPARRRNTWARCARGLGGKARDDASALVARSRAPGDRRCGTGPASRQARGRLGERVSRSNLSESPSFQLRSPYTQ